MSGGAQEVITFELDGVDVDAYQGETIWQASKRHATDIPHLCYADEPGYRADGNCRACMVEIEGERVLAASCIRTPAPGMKVTTNNERAEHARAMVMELLVADQPARDVAHDGGSRLWQWAERMSVTESRLPRRARQPAPDPSHTAMRVNLDACIHCNLCVRACREVQVNDVIGMAYRGHGAKIVFDFDDPMGSSTCVACGECVQACPTGALMEASLVDEKGVGFEIALEEVDSLCPYCGVGCQMDLNVDPEGNDGRGKVVKVTSPPVGTLPNDGNLCVKGRFAYNFIDHEDRLTTPLIRGEDGDLHPASWDEALERAATGLLGVKERHGADALGFVSSSRCTGEENFLIQKFARAVLGTNNIHSCAAT